MLRTERSRREGFVLRRGFVAKRAGKETRDGIENEHRGQFAAAENIVADGDFVRGQMRGYTFVHAFVAAADKQNALELGKAAGGFLIEKLARGGKQNDACLRIGRNRPSGIANGMTEQ